MLDVNSKAPNNFLTALFWLSVAIISCLAFEVLAVTAVMPHISKILNGENYYTFAFGAALAMQIVGTILGGIICDRFTPAWPLVVGTALFTVGLLICAIAPSMQLIIIGRSVQGIGGGLLVVAIYALVALVVPNEMKKRYFAGFATAWVLPSLIGPAIAGYITDLASWRWVFAIIPLFIVVISLLSAPFLRSLPLRLHSAIQSQQVEKTQDSPNSPRRNSWNRKVSGQVFLALVLAVSAAYVQIYAANSDGSQSFNLVNPTFLCSFAIMLLALYLILPSGVITLKPGLPATLVTRALLMGSYVGAELLIPLYLNHQGWTTSQTGLVITVGSLGWTAGSQLQSKIKSNSLQTRISFSGLLVGAISLLATALVPLQYLPVLTLLVAWTVIGFGTGVSFPALTMNAFAAVNKTNSGEVSAALQTADCAGSVIFIALTGIIFRSVSSNYSNLAVFWPLLFCAFMIAFAAFISLRSSQINHKI